MKKILIALICVIALIAVAVYNKNYKQNQLEPTTKTPVDNLTPTQNPDSTTIEPTEAPTSSLTIEEYVSQNISTLSTTPEVLGGKFFVTKIEAHGGVGTVSYEDGHNAYTADFTYSVDAQGNPTVQTFVVRQK